MRRILKELSPNLPEEKMKSLASNVLDALTPFLLTKDPSTHVNWNFEKEDYNMLNSLKKKQEFGNHLNYLLDEAGIYIEELTVTHVWGETKEMQIDLEVRVKKWGEDDE